MAFVHGKDTYVSIDGHDISTYTNTSTFSRGADSHDVTTYGKDDHVFAHGLRTTTATLGGFCDTVSGGPGDVFRVIHDAAAAVTFIRRVEGTGSGKPQESVTVLVTSYAESSPVADMVTWTAELQCSDAITTTNQ